jgi:hypothetical protein
METLEDNIKSFLFKGTTLEAIQVYGKSVAADPEKNKHLILLETRMRRNNAQFIRGLVTLEESRVEETRIVKSLLELLDAESIEPGTINIPATGFTEKILLICRKENDRATLHELLKRFKFRNVQSEVAHSFDSLKTKLKPNLGVDDLQDSEGYQALITIWDNRDLKPCPEEEKINEIGIGGRDIDLIYSRVSFLNDCMDGQLSPYYMHYGEQFYFVNDQRDMVYSANSRFALVGRLKEMLDYIKAYGG